MIRTFAALAAVLTVGAVMVAKNKIMTFVQAVGVVKAIDAANGKVTIEHEPIAALQWPAMTMRFTFKDPKLVEGLKAGDKIHFTFTQEGQLSVLQSIEH